MTKKKVYTDFDIKIHEISPTAKDWSSITNGFTESIDIEISYKVKERPISFITTADLVDLYKIIEIYVDLKDNEISEITVGSPTPVGCILFIKKSHHNHIRLVFLASKTEVFNRPENIYFMIFVDFNEFFIAVKKLKDELIQRLEILDPNDKYNYKDAFFECWQNIENKYLTWNGKFQRMC